MVQHLQMWDFVSLSGTMENRIIEYVDQQHEHFEYPVYVKNAKYQLPKVRISSFTILFNRLIRTLILATWL